MSGARGFTLVELIIVMLVVSIGFVGLANMFSSMQTALTSAEAQQKTQQYAQACAEYVLKIKRDNGYNSALLVNTMCNSLRSPTDTTAGYTVTPTIGADYSATGVCPTTPATATCKDVTIAASGGGMSSSVTITLMNY